MGKTKTAFIEEVTVEKSGKEAYEEKMRKKAAAQKAQEEKDKAQVKKVGLKGGERIKVVGADLPVETPQTPVEGTEPSVTTVADKKAKPKVRSEKYKKVSKKIDKNKTYKLGDAIKLVKETSYSKFDGTMELHIVVKKNKVMERVTLPHSAGKEKSIEVADEKTIAKLKKGVIDFDILLATADMMPKLVPFARLLGPRGMMPNPKAGTLIKDKKEAGKFAGNTMTLKTEKDQPVVHTVCGKVSQKDSEIEKNIEVIFQALGGSKQIEKAHLKSTMSPSVKLQI